MRVLGGMESGQWDDAVTREYCKSNINPLFRVQGMTAKSFVISVADYQLLQLCQRYNEGFLETQVH